MIKVLLSTMLLVVQPVAASEVLAGADVVARAPTYDLASFYPNASMAFNGYYLNGYNHNSSPPSRSVLWFENMSSGRFRMYNSLPGERCHFDELTWQSRQLVYSKTYHRCEGAVHESTYSPPIVFIPRQWSGTSWSRTGESQVTQRLDGAIVCTGTNKWKAQIIGWIDIAPGERGIHWRSTQTTTWKSGSCAPWTTRWQEDYVMSTSIAGGAPGLKRSIGGNLDGGFNWDVWMDRWERI